MKRSKSISRYGEIDYKRLSGKDSDDEGTELLIQKSSYIEPPTVEKVIEEGDTLQAIAIRYHCTVSELKRLNHIINDNEIFAKRTIKVPDRPFSAILASIHHSGCSSPCGAPSSSKDVDITVLKSKLSKNNLCNDVNDIIFNSSVVYKVNDGTEIEEIEDEQVKLLPNDVQELSGTASGLSCSGADADISWVTLTVCVVIMIVVLPLIYIFYIAEHPDHYHHHNANNVKVINR